MALKVGNNNGNVDHESDSDDDDGMITLMMKMITKITTMM